MLSCTSGDVDARCRRTLLAYHRDNSPGPDRGWHCADHTRCPVSAGVRGWPRPRSAAYAVLDFADSHIRDSRLAGRPDCRVLRPWTTSIRCWSRSLCVRVSANCVPQGPHAEVEASRPASRLRFRFGLTQWRKEYEMKRRVVLSQWCSLFPRVLALVPVKLRSQPRKRLRLR